jgi:Beta-lactamase enzyme family
VIAPLVAAAALATISPGSGEAFFGVVTATGPASATGAELRVRGGRPRHVRVRRGEAVFRLPPGRYDLAVRFVAGSRLVGRVRAERVWSLPNDAQRAAPPRSGDRRLSARLAALGSSFPGYAGLWFHDLASGRTAGWNADASFPAASIVKLGVLVAALDRWGADPVDPRIGKEIRDLAVWSSNLASNRLIVRLGGSESAGAALVTRTLWRLGATSSTFSGFYRLGTSVGPKADSPRPPPFFTYRRTTARDTGRILYVLHAAAVGRADALRRTRLSRGEARVALGLLLSSDPAGDNAGLFRRSLGPAVPMAQKQGWTTSIRHTAAIVYGPRGPSIVVLLTYRHELDVRAAHALGDRLVQALRPF